MIVWHIMRRCVVLLVALALLIGSSPVGATPSKEQVSAARALAYAGYQLLQQEQYADAYDRFQQAEKIFHAPPHLLYMARAKRGMGELVAARDLYQRLADEQVETGSPKEFAKATEDARQELEELQPRIPSVAITLSGASLDQATVDIDGRDVTEAAREGAVDVDPGERVVRATAEGFEAAETTVTLEEGASAVAVQLTLQALPAPEPGPTGTSRPGQPPDTVDEPGSMIPGFVVMGVGVAAVGVGIATGVVAMGKADELSTNCPVRSACPPDNESLEDDARLFGTVSTVGFIVGGAALAGGAVLLWLRPGGGGGGDEPEPAAAGVTIEPLVGPGAFGIRGTF
jgi:hypothetical protein